jgi:hypothetical protein
MLRTIPHRWLPSLEGLERDAHHRYRLGDHSFPVSVTGVLASQKSAYSRQIIEATRADWGPRGTTVHRALELAATVDGWHPDYWPECWPFIDWIEPLLTHALWDGVYCCASERATCSILQNIAGTYDGAFLAPRSTPGWSRILFDLKTQGSPESGPYDVRPQLGGYLALEAERGITFDGACAIWARPGRTRVSPVYDVEECLAAWNAALTAYRAVEARVARAAAAGVECDPRYDPFSL